MLGMMNDSSRFEDTSRHGAEKYVWAFNLFGATELHRLDQRRQAET